MTTVCEDEELGPQSENQFLKDPVSLADLISNGAQFEINTDYDIPESMFDELNLGQDDENADDSKNPVDYTKIVSPWTKTFAELKTQMTEVNEYIHKRTIKKGDTAGGLVPNNARVCIRYNAYWEGESAPFDSLFLRGSSFSFYTGRQEVIVGLEEAVLTMCRGEHAQFVISYHLLMGEMGCPPRVKPRADGLYIVELMSFNDVGDMNAAEALNDEERKQFSKLIEKIKDIHLKGRDFFGQRMYKNAITTFEKAVNLLNVCHLANDEEEKAHTEFLIKLYTNLAVCYIKVNQPKKTCVMCKQLRYLTNNRPSCKALFQEGRALLMLDDFERARTVLKDAQNMEPQNLEINAELTKLHTRYERHKTSEQRFWRNAFGGTKKTEQPETNGVSDVATNVTDIYKENMRENLQLFKETISENTLKLKCLSQDEIKTVHQLANEMDLKFHISPRNPSVYVLSK